MAKLSAVDSKFLRAMVTHHQDAVKMSTAYLADNSAPRRANITALARGIIAAQNPEIARMVAWLRDDGQAPAKPAGKM